MIRTVTGALRAIHACRTLDALTALWARIGSIAWNGPTVRAAYEAKRDALTEAGK